MTWLALWFIFNLLAGVYGAATGMTTTVTWRVVTFQAAAYSFLWWVAL